MKKLLKVLVLLVILSVSSCWDEENSDQNNGGDCKLDFIDLDQYFSKAIYIDFIDDDNGWIIGKSPSFKHVLLNTSDGGATWTEIDDDLQLDYDNGFVKGEALQFVTANNGFKELGHSENKGKLSLQYTTDKGATWNEYNNPFFDINNKPVDISWGATFASNGSETIIFGSDGYVLKINNSTMGITSFVKLNKNYNILNGGEIGYHYSANNTITAVVTEIDNADIKIAQSTDDGVTWTITSDVLGGELISSTWPNDNIGFVAVISDDEVIYKTTDGGANWSELSSSSKLPKFQMIRFADENNGIGVTDFDFYTTDDGGKTWKKITCKDNNGYSYGAGFDEVLSYPSLNNGWIPGNNNNISKNGVFHYTGK